MSQAKKRLHAPRYALIWGSVIVAKIHDATPFLEGRKSKEVWNVEHRLPGLKDLKNYKNCRQAAIAAEKAIDNWKADAGLTPKGEWKVDA